MATKKLDYEHDKKGFEDAQKLATVLHTQGQKKKDVLLKCEDIYLMRGRSIKPGTELRKAVSPDGKNKLKGARRLLSAGTPQFRVPREKNTEAEEMSSTLEQVGGLMWSQSNHIQGLRLESELPFSGLLYDEMIVNVICMQDVVDDVQDAYTDEKDKWEKARWEGRLAQAQNQAALTPYLFECVSPMMYFPKYGRFGTSHMYSEVKRSVAEVKAQWGARSLKAIGLKKDTDEVTECTLIDNTFKYVWLTENKSEPIFADVHGMAMMQTIAVRAAGSNLFSETEDQYDPFLKTMSESGLCELQDSILTALNTNLNATLEAQMIFTQGAAGDDIVPMFDKFLGMWKLPPNSKLDWMVKDVLSRDIIGALELVRGINSESTIYDQALGAGSGKNDPYGLVSLLSQAGRLPLTDVQKMMGELGARTMEVAFSWWKAKGKKSKLQAKYGKDLEINPSDIPETIRFECDVEIDLPQDKLQMANTGAKLMEMGASWEYVASYMGIENPDQMAKQKWFEEARRAAGLKKIEEIITKLTTPPTPPPAPVQNTPLQGATRGEGGMQGQPTPEQMAAMQAQAQGGAGQGMPPAVQTPRGQPTQADMSGQMPPEPTMLGGM